MLPGGSETSAACPKALVCPPPDYGVAQKAKTKAKNQGQPGLRY